MGALAVDARPMNVTFPPEQLEFDLWAEETFSEYDIARNIPRWAELRYLLFTRRHDVQFRHSLTSMYTTVRYRV